jgi:lipopolysaccharide/colanic/teichoic acid biosynthesis glycosyltransferase
MADSSDNTNNKEQPSPDKINRVNRSVKIALSTAIPLGFLLIFIIIAIALKFKSQRDEKKKKKHEKAGESEDEKNEYIIPPSKNISHPKSTIKEIP